MNKFFVTISFTYEGDELDKIFDRCIYLYDTNMKKKYKTDNFVISSRPVKKEDYS